jgi:DNA replication ATP-dependent helicase Dna2
VAEESSHTPWAGSTFLNACINSDRCAAWFWQSFRTKRRVRAFARFAATLIRLRRAMTSQVAVRQDEINDLAARIRAAIRDELNASSRGMPFRAWDINRAGAVLHMVLTPEGKLSILDETLEEGRMSWEADTTGSAEVISVLPAVSVINACLTTGQPPREGSLVYVNPPRYLEALLSLWEDGKRAAEIARWIFDLGGNRITWDEEVPFSVFNSLRPAQERSFSLVKWKTSFLWGPPGTGKTHTLGRLLASYLTHYTDGRVLLLSSTNVAVDLAILAVDDALNELGPASRPVCYRFGSRLDPQKFQNRKRLTPLRDRELVDKLRRHYEVVPDPANAELYHKWRQERDRLREAIRKENLEFLASARLAAMTTTLAAHDFTSLGNFDLVVFDEASQVGKAQAATFSLLGTRTLFAGDPRQLAPIAQGASPDVNTWLGQSPFEWTSRASLQQATCMLDEQWRMASPICSAVSELFYGSKLRVADPLVRDGAWLQGRQPAPTRLMGNDNIVLVDTGAAAKAAQRFRGYECEESGVLIAALVVDHILSWSIANIRDELIVLTPYRAQRRRIEAELTSINAPVSAVSTVHRAQGSEKRVVIFDPVCPTADFVAGQEGMRLVNVAFSRAQCRLIVMLQRGWEDHPALRFLAKRHRPIVLNRDSVAKLLLTKLPSPPPTRPTVSQTGESGQANTKAAQPAIFEEFVTELRARVPNGASKAAVQRAAKELRDKAKFRKLSFAEVDAAISIVLKG